MARNAARGWLTLKRVSAWRGWVVAGCLLAAPAHAAETAETPEPLPEDEFLEFLGDWEAVDGEWIDPVALAELESEGELVDTGIRQGQNLGGDDENES